MSEVLSVIAFMMALGAVYLANDAVVKSERSNEGFIKMHVDTLKAMIKQRDQRSNDFDKNVQALTIQMKDLRESLEDLSAKIESQESNSEALRADLQTLKESIPPNKSRSRQAP